MNVCHWNGEFFTPLHDLGLVLEKLSYRATLAREIPNYILTHPRVGRSPYYTTIWLWTAQHPNTPCMEYLHIYIYITISIHWPRKPHVGTNMAVPWVCIPKILHTNYIPNPCANDNSFTFTAEHQIRLRLFAALASLADGLKLRHTFLRSWRSCGESEGRLCGLSPEISGWVEPQTNHPKAVIQAFS